MKYRLVPVEPTKEMQECAWNAWFDNETNEMELAIRAAIAAAPKVVVTDEMVERAAEAYWRDPVNANKDVKRSIRAALEAALNGDKP